MTHLRLLLCHLGLVLVTFSQIMFASVEVTPFFGSFVAFRIIYYAIEKVQTFSLDDLSGGSIN